MNATANIQEPMPQIIVPPARINLAAVPPPAVNLMGMWNTPLSITKNNFVNKSLSMWACNIGVGCSHSCLFCYVPDSSTKFLEPELAQLGVEDPDQQWGEYSFLRTWDEEVFLKSLRSAENTPAEKLNRDGNRAVMYCTSTDPYQVLRGPDAQVLNQRRRDLMRRSLELIRDRSTVNVRILTRSPLARQDFELMRTFGNRLVLGMSIPTLDNEMARVFEPHAPAATQRLATLVAAKEAGIPVYVALAPVYPDCDEADLRATFQAITQLDPVTIYMEPINVRAENVERIANHAREIGRNVNVDVFRTKEAWTEYALGQLFLTHRLAREMGVEERLHLWPDAALKAKGRFMQMRSAEFARVHPGVELARAQRAALKQMDQLAYEQHLAWLEGWWSRISEWPGVERAAWTPPALPANSPFTAPALQALTVNA